MASFKQLISTAVHKLYELNKRYDDADVFCVDLFKLLDNEKVEPGNGVPDGYVSDEAPAHAPAPAPAPKPKLTKEQKEAEKAAKAAAKAEKEAAKATKVAKPKEPKPELNMTKLNPTQKKLLAKIAPWATDEFKQIFINDMNALTPDEFNDKTMEQHMREHFPNEPKTEVEPEPTVELDCDEVEFKGKTYWVAADKTVYDKDELTSNADEVYRKVGMLGMAYFKDMKIPEE